MSDLMKFLSGAAGEMSTTLRSEMKNMRATALAKEKMKHQAGTAAFQHASEMAQLQKAHEYKLEEQDRLYAARAKHGIGAGGVGGGNFRLAQAIADQEGISLEEAWSRVRRNWKPQVIKTTDIYGDPLEYIVTAEGAFSPEQYNQLVGASGHLQRAGLGGAPPPAMPAPGGQQMAPGRTFTDKNGNVWEMNPQGQLVLKKPGAAEPAPETTPARKSGKMSMAAEAAELPTSPVEEAPAMPVIKAPPKKEAKPATQKSRKEARAGAAPQAEPPKKKPVNRLSVREMEAEIGNDAAEAVRSSIEMSRTSRRARKAFETEYRKKLRAAVREYRRRNPSERPKPVASTRGN